MFSYRDRYLEPGGERSGWPCTHRLLLLTDLLMNFACQGDALTRGWAGGSYALVRSFRMLTPQ